jgi:NADPH:quinone reductase-like Zn-dependent oxidoreductase
VRAIVLRRFGAPEELKLEELEVPLLASGEVLVKVATVSINRGFDISFRRGQYARGGSLPMVLGADPVGTIAAIGEGVADRRIGERVAVMSTIACLVCASCRQGRISSCETSQTIGVHRPGAYADYVAVPARNIALIPDDLDFPAAMVAARHGSAAFNFLVKRGGLRMGETVLVNGASGALGGFCVQIAKSAGIVIAAAGARNRVDAALALGADHGIDYRSENLEARVKELTGGRGVDLAFESSADADIFPRVVASLAPGGRLITAGAHAGHHVPLDIKTVYGKRLQLIGAAGTDVSDLDWALAAAAGGKITARLDRSFQLSEAAAAHRYVEDQSPTGKVYLTP